MSNNTLKRTLSLPLVVAYGLGTILGAGIYVLIAAVAAEAGVLMPISFVLAGVVAAFSAFSYAALSSRFPKAAGEAVYVDRAFANQAFTKLVGFSVVVVGIVSGATIVKGFAGYLQLFIAAPAVPASLILVLILGSVAVSGINESVWTATAITVIEVAGLIFIIVIAAPTVPNLYAADVALLPSSEWSQWAAVSSGAFLAFYAFIGFEDMVNIAEEVREPETNMPRAIIWALVLSTVLYTVLAVVVVAALSIDEITASDAPLARIAEARGIDARVLGFVGMVAVVNGALVQIIMASRVLFGMANQGWLPAWLARVSPRTRTPANATIVVTAVICVFVAALPLVQLASIASFITLLIFAAINAALWAIQRDGTSAGGFVVPRWVPAGGTLLCLALVALKLAQSV